MDECLASVLRGQLPTILPTFMFSQGNSTMALVAFCCCKIPKITENVTETFIWWRSHLSLNFMSQEHVNIWLRNKIRRIRRSIIRIRSLVILVITETYICLSWQHFTPSNEVTTFYIQKVKGWPDWEGRLWPHLVRFWTADSFHLLCHVGIFAWWWCWWCCCTRWQCSSLFFHLFTFTD